MDDPTDDFAPRRQRLARDLQTLTEDAEALLRHAREDAGEGYAEARARLQASLARVKEQIASREQSARYRVRQAGSAVEHYVHENPWGAIGISAAVGLLAGVLLTRR